MAFMANWKGQLAVGEHGKGNNEKAEALYEEAYQAGCNKPRILLSYAILLLRSGKYEKACEVLRKTEKLPGLTPEQRTQMLTHYAVGIWRLGNLPHAIELLQEVFRKGKSGLIYGTLGCLLMETGDFEAARQFNMEAVDYDEEDPVALDNLAQTYYRLSDQKDEARKWFDKAYAIKPEQIDTLYFLAQYDLEAGDRDAAREKLEKAREGRFSPLNYATVEKIDQQLAGWDA